MKKVLKFILKYLIIFLATSIGAIGINIFLVPHQIAAGGVTGLSTIIFYLTNKIIPLGIIILTINIPLFIWGFFSLGYKRMFKIIYATIIFTLIIDISQGFLNNIASNLVGSSGEIDLLLFALFGGAISGIGLGIVYKYDSNTGGVDLLSEILRKKGVNLSMGQVMFIVDAIIVIIAAIAFNSMLLGMYAIITILVFSKVVDLILDGVGFAKGLYIISDKYQEISEAILGEMERGVTGIRSVGKYTKTEREMLFCVTRAKQVVKVKNIIKEIDPEAFVVLTDVREVLGEGFQGFDITKP